MEGEHAAALRQEMHDTYQAFPGHAGYLDAAQVQGMAHYLGDFAALDPASQAAVMQQYAEHIPAEGVRQEEQKQQQLPQSETESDLEDGVDAGRYFFMAWFEGAETPKRIKG